MKIAVIDIGTLKVKFLLVENSSSDKFETKYQSNTLTCLGVRMSENNNRPFPEYLEQTFTELKRCKEIIDKEGVEKLRVVSTHALREMGGVGREILEKYYLSKSHPYRVKISEMEDFLTKIISIPYDQREEMFKFDQKYYMWGIEKAFLNIISICKKEQSPFVVPSNSSINDGLVLSLIE